MNEEEWMTEGFSRKTQGRGALGVRGKRTLLERVQGVSDALSLWSPSDLTQDQLNCLCWTRWRKTKLTYNSQSQSLSYCKLTAKSSAEPWKTSKRMKKKS
ncbi:uncharacterized protein AB9X84_002874 isoform 2-T2 [Acanthopagrus schlegelii]